MENRLAIYKRLLGYLRPYTSHVSIAYIAMLGTTLLNLFIPQIIKNAIDNGIAAGQASGLYTAAGLILGIAVVRGLAGFGQRYYGEWLSHRVSFDLRNHFYASVQKLPFAFHDKASTGDLMSRATSDITESERFVGIGLMDLLAVVILLVGVIVAMLIENLQLTLMVLPTMALLVFMALRFGNRIRPLFKKIQEQMGILSGTMQESMTGIGVVKAFAREGQELEKFDKENDEWFTRRYAAIRMWSTYWPFFSFILAVSILILLWFGGPRALNGEITVGSLFALISYVLMLNAPVMRMGFLVNMAATASASASRVFEIIDTYDTIQDKPDAVEMPQVRGDITFEHVDFGYREDQKILHDVHFEAKSGQVIALIGPTGAGKSSVTALIPRFYDPTAGRVLLDGVDLREIQIASLRSHVGAVLQEPFLFGVTIAQNIAYGRPDATQEEIETVAKAARAHDFILSFPDGYDTRVGERGVTLSGGQKQRIAIARALLFNPRILILDDSTSAVDTETEHLIQQALDDLMEGRTTFVIAQRLLTLKSADCILVMDGGRIVERGTHDELLAQRGLYRELYDLQLKDQEEFTDTQDEMPDGETPSATPQYAGGSDQ